MVLFAFLIRLDAVNTNAMELSLVPCRLKRIPWIRPSQDGCGLTIATISVVSSTHDKKRRHNNTSYKQNKIIMAS